MNSPKIPRWRKWLSYLFERTLETVTDADGNDLSVILKNGRLMLVSNNAIYSYDDLYLNFKEAFLRMNKNLTENDNVLVLGLGLGSIPYIIEKILNQKPHYTLVEIDEEVIYLASKYGLSRLTANFEIQAADASAFIYQNSETYDLVCMDVFNDDLVPAHMTTSEFLILLKATLNEDGLLLYNRLYQYEKDKRETDTFEHDAFSKVFPDYTYVEVEGNRVYYSSKQYICK